MMSHPFYQNSECRNKYLHRFSIVDEFPEGVLEVCEICHRRKFHKIIDGHVSNRDYMSYHVRQALPTSHPLHYHEHEYYPLSDKIRSPYEDELD